MHIKNFFICGIFLELHWKKKKSYKVLRIFRKNKIKILRKILRYITLFTCLFTFRVVTAANFQEPTQKYFDWVVDLVLARTHQLWSSVLGQDPTKGSNEPIKSSGLAQPFSLFPNITFFSNKHYDSSSSWKSLKPTLS